MPISNDKRTLTGGRALYTGKNAYASQGFENDARQSKLGALLSATLYGPQNLPASTYTELLFPDYASKLYRAVFTRNFSRIPDTGKFVAQKTMTVRITANAETTSLAAGQLLIFVVNITRGADLIQLTGITQDTGVGAAFLGVERIWTGVDLFAGDVISMTVNPSASGGCSATGATSGTSPSGGLLESWNGCSLTVEELDLQ